MKFFKRKFNAKLILSTIGMALLLFVGSTQFTHAQVSDFLGIPNISDLISTFAFAISYLLSVIFGVIIAIESWLIGITLNINANILQTVLVQTGFSISLSIVNLAFVLGIIVIALATILRNNTYGIKQLLWKLVVMAILVNFGLVIMSPIFALGNSFTQYFLNCINPGSGGCTQSTSSLTSFNNFGVTMAAAFNPANPFTAPGTASSSEIAALQTSSTIKSSFNVSSAGTSLGQSVVPIFGIVFVAIDLILIVVVLGGFISLLTIRYLYIAILAILLPFAWAAWVFPSFNSHWKKWWETFIRWTFFAPIVLFFIYLALLTMKGVGATGVFDVTQYTKSDNVVWAAITRFLTNLITPVISSFIQEILLGGLIIGGMIAANSMGIKMAGAVVDVAKKGGDMAKTWTKNQAKKGRTWAYQKTDKGVKKLPGGIGLTERLQTGAIPGLKYIPLGRRGASLAARGIQGSTVASNSKMVEDAQKSAPKSWEVAKKNLEGSMNTEDQFAHIAVGIKEGKIKATDDVNGKTVAQFLDDQDMVSRYGQGKLVSDFDKVTASTANSRRAKIAIDKGDALVTVVKDVKDANGNVIESLKAGTKVNPQVLKTAAEIEYIRDSKREDLGKGQSQFGREAAKDKKEYDNRLNVLIDYNPAAISTVMSKLDAIYDKKTFYDSLAPKFDLKLKEFDHAQNDLKSAQAKVKEIEKIDEAKRDESQKKQLAFWKIAEQTTTAQLKSLSTKTNLELDQARASLNKTYKARFEPDIHQEHGGHDDDHKKDDDKSHGGGGGGGHAATPPPPRPTPPPSPSSGGGGSSSSGGHGGGGHH